jgi:hypothetical protein
MFAGKYTVDVKCIAGYLFVVANSSSGISIVQIFKNPKYRNQPQETVKCFKKEEPYGK